ncbi:hypothetical protein ACF068_29705 [Streptomyces sp. NPDC016309]|uniref:hypothetical protein n=1 Tax=Streptomyces sp. NPDC016309 TaxID=3364965 RepID=UPI003701A3DD
MGDLTCRMAVVLVVAPLCLAGCSAGAPSPRERTRAAIDTFCEDLGALRMDAGKMAGLGARSRGRDELRDLREDVAHDLDLVAQSARNVRRARAGPVSAAYDRVSRAVDDVPGGATGAQAAARIRPHLEALDRAVAASQASVKC